MPEISLLGWFHTGIAIVALVAGLYSMLRYKFIDPMQMTGKVYLLCTLIAAITALMIYQHGKFGPAHGLAVLTLLALIIGSVAARTSIFGKFSAYIQAISFTGTFLFHMIPAITDGLMRLPVDTPVVTSIEDPLLKRFYLSFLVVYIIVVSFQIIRIRKLGKES